MVWHDRQLLLGRLYGGDRHRAVEGHHIFKAKDAEDAEVILVGTRRDLILMDIALPGMHGLTFT